MLIPGLLGPFVDPPSFLSIASSFFIHGRYRERARGVRNRDGRREIAKGVGGNVKNVKDMIDGERKKEREDGGVSAGRAEG